MGKVYLSINGNKIKQFIFVAVDGGRIFVPLTKFINNGNGIRKYYWEKNSLDFKIGKIIGEFYIYNSIEEIAKRSKIEIK